MNAYAYRTTVRAKSLESAYAEAANDARYSSPAAESLSEDRDTRWVNAITFIRCIVGPLVLFVLLLSTIQWNGSGSAAASVAQPGEPSELVRATAVFKSFHEQFATRFPGVEAHVEAF